MSDAARPTEEARGRLVRSASVITVLTLASRLTGYARDRVIAALFGASAASDVFYTAFRIPNLLRQLVAEGALPGVFIPSYTEKLKKGSAEEARVFAARILSALTVIVTAITILGIVFAPAIVKLLAKGFASTPGKIPLTIFLTRLMFPYLCFISVAALLQAVLNAHGRFAVSAMSPILLNLSIILAAALLSPRFSEPTVALAIGVLVGGILQMAIQIRPALALGAIGKWSVKFSDPAVRAVFLLLLPRLFGFGIYAINNALSTRFASVFGDGAVSYLTFGNRVIELVRGGFVISVSTAILPLLAQQALEDDARSFKDTLRFGLRLVAFVTIPWAVGLAVLRETVIAALFQGGRFGPDATAATAQALSLYALGLFFISSNSLLVFAHYARKDTRTPVLCAAVDLTVFVLVSLALRPWGVASVAFATSCGAAANFVLLLSLLRRREGRLGGRELLASLGRVIVAAGVMALVVGSAAGWALGALAPRTAGTRFLFLVVATFAGMAVYLGVAILLRSREPAEFVRLLTQRRRRTPTA
ncbi:MAG TPA: murein biosynthesis integral membrane protein MurJ [Thermoanaerobaculia bacterium]|nr:murein biosynthesis integral membrane protein MurJ [Thermoanaerobaculia bacterium]